MSTLAVTTILHLVVGLVVAAVMLDDSPLRSKIGLDVIAGIFGAFAVAVGRAIHGKSIVSPWLLLAVVPTAVGLWLVPARPPAQPRRVPAGRRGAAARRAARSGPPGRAVSPPRVAATTSDRAAGRAPRACPGDPPRSTSAASAPPTLGTRRAGHRCRARR